MPARRDDADDVGELWISAWKRLALSRSKASCCRSVRDIARATCVARAGSPAGSSSLRGPGDSTTITPRGPPATEMRVTRTSPGSNGEPVAGPASESASKPGTSADRPPSGRLERDVRRPEPCRPMRRRDAQRSQHLELGRGAVRFGGGQPGICGHPGGRSRANRRPRARKPRSWSDRRGHQVQAGGREDLFARRTVCS